MNTAKRILSVVLVFLGLQAGQAAAQVVEKGGAARPPKNEAVKNESTATGQPHTREGAVVTERAPAPRPQPAEHEEKKWGLQVTTGEKWYQVSIKLVM